MILLPQLPILGLQAFGPCLAFQCVFSNSVYWVTICFTGILRLLHCEVTTLRAKPYVPVEEVNVAEITHIRYVALFYFPLIKLKRHGLYRRMKRTRPSSLLFSLLLLQCWGPNPESGTQFLSRKWGYHKKNWSCFPMQTVSIPISIYIYILQCRLYLTYSRKGFRLTSER